MEQFWSLVKYIEEHPVAGLAGLAGLYVLYRLLNRKPKYMREADTRMDELRRRSGDPYNKLRPPQ